MQIKLPHNVECILNRLENNGHRADIVGGPVRDFLLGRMPEDYDITTSASPEEIKAVFDDLRTVDTGIKHGTVSVILDGVQYEVTTYRIDGEYKDSRHPETVTFTKNIEEDLRRRDFTMNAIAYSPKHGITDPYGGREDVSAGIIRAVGDPYLRFSEDALRILRGVRFAAALGFSVEKETSDAMQKTRSLLQRVSVERIYTELCKTLSGKHSYDIITEFSDVIIGVVPELLGTLLPDKALYEKADYISRLIALFYLNSQNPKESYAEAMKRLHTDSRTREIGENIIPLIKSADTESDLGLNLILREIGPAHAESLINVRALLGLCDSDAKDRLKKLLDRGTPYRVSDLKIGGKELLSIGAKGKQVGEILEDLLSLVIEGSVENNRDSLLMKARATLEDY